MREEGRVFLGEGTERKREERNEKEELKKERNGSERSFCVKSLTKGGLCTR